MWRYNKLGENKGSTSYLLMLNNITAGYILLTANLVYLKMENPELILIVNRIEWRKFIDYSGLIIEVDPSRVWKKNIFSILGIYQALHMERPYIKAISGKIFEFGITKDTSVPN